MRALEQRARDAWETARHASVSGLKSGRAEAHMQELVALGIEDETGDAYVWWELTNEAVVPEGGRGEFYVDGLVIWDTLKAAADQLGYLRIGADTRRAIDTMLRERVCVIWHTHTATVDPSKEDVAEFPRWLAEAGMVYHVPTGTTTVYNESGVISSIQASTPAVPVSTEDV